MPEHLKAILLERHFWGSTVPYSTSISKRLLDLSSSYYTDFFTMQLITSSMQGFLDLRIQNTTLTQPSHTACTAGMPCGLLKPWIIIYYQTVYAGCGAFCGILTHCLNQAQNITSRGLQTSNINLQLEQLHSWLKTGNELCTWHHVLTRSSYQEMWWALGFGCPDSGCLPPRQMVSVS